MKLLPRHLNAALLSALHNRGYALKLYSFSVTAEYLSEGGSHEIPIKVPFLQLLDTETEFSEALHYENDEIHVPFVRLELLSFGWLHYSLHCSLHTGFLRLAGYFLGGLSVFGELFGPHKEEMALGFYLYVEQHAQLQQHLRYISRTPEFLPFDALLLCEPPT